MRKQSFLDFARTLAIPAMACLLVSAATSYAAEQRAKAKRVDDPGAVTENRVATEETSEVISESARAERTLMRKPRDRAIRLQAARAQLAEGAEVMDKVNAAQAHVAAVLQDNPNDSEALMLAGQINVLKNDPASAARFYRSATLADPGNPSAFLGLGDALSRMGDEAGSTQAFAKYRELKGMQSLTPQAGSN